MKWLKSLRLIIGVHTLVITLLAVASTWLCLRYEIIANFPLTLIGTAIIFPIVFSISGAYKRRESALRERQYQGARQGDLFCDPRLAARTRQ